MNYRSGRFILWAVAGLITAVGLFLLLSDNGGNGGRRGFGGTSVKVEAVSQQNFADIIEAIGTAKANESVVLTARVSETVQSVNFADGQYVEKGTIIVELTNTEERALKAEAEATAREAEAQYARIMDLEKLGSAPASLVDNRLKQVEEARERLNATNARLEDRIIRAPFAGVLGLRNVSQGTLVSPGLEITTLDDVDIIKLDFSVPERFISALAQGQKIEAYATAYKNRAFLGEVQTIASRVDPVSRAVMVRAILDNTDHALRPGMLLSVSLSSNERLVLSISPTALVPVGNEDFVYVVGDENKVIRQRVEVGQRENDKVEILNGLLLGDSVVTSGTLRLRDGAGITIIE